MDQNLFSRPAASWKSTVHTDMVNLPVVDSPWPVDSPRKSRIVPNFGGDCEFIWTVSKQGSKQFRSELKYLRKKSELQ